MPENDKTKLQGRVQEGKKTEAKTVSTLGVEGEIPCIVVYSDEKHVEYINNILNPLRELLSKRGFNPMFLSDEMKSLEHYGKKFEQLTEECALGIVILDGLRPNVLLEFGILMGKNKPIILLQDEKAVVAIKSYYQNGSGTGLTTKQFNNLKEPSLGFFSHISDLQGLHVETVNKDASLSNFKYPRNVIGKAIDKLMSRIIEEYKGVTLKFIPRIKPDHLHEFQSITFNILEYYAGIKPFKVNDIENAIAEVKKLEKNTGINLPSRVYATLASLYVRLAEKTEWKDVHKIMNYYDQAIEIYKRILEFEGDPTLRSQAQKKIGDIYWEVSQFRDKTENCKKAIETYEEALKVYTLDRFPMDYAMTQNNLGVAYRTLAEVEAKTENCKKAIEAHKEALKVRTLDRFPMDYAMTQNNLGVAYRTLAEVEAKTENCKKAIEAYEEALKVYTLDRFPMDYAMTQNNLGAAYRTLAEVEAKTENCKKAIEAHKEALKVFTKEEFPEIYPLVERNLRKLLNFCKGEGV